MRQHRLFILVWVVIAMLIGCDKDDNPPRVISITPRTGANGEILVTNQRRGDVNGPLIKAQFNEALLESSIPADALILKYNGEALPGISDFVPQINMVAFEPDEQLLFLRQYDVTLRKGIADLEGNRDTEGKNWSFRVRDGSFSSAIFVEESTGMAIDPQITVGAGEHGQYVWSQFDTGTTRSSIWARALQINLLEQPVRLEIDGANDANSPQVAVDAVGRATAVWSHFDGTNWRIRANRFTPDELEQPQDENVSGTWGIPMVVTITIASPGVVSWTAHGLANDREVVLETTGALPTGLTEGTTYYVRNATADSFELSATPGGASINTSETQSGTHTVTAFSETISVAGSDATIPQIAVDTDGNYIAVWVQSDGRIYANRYTGSWGSATAIDANTGTPASPQIAIDGGNNAIAVWSQSDGTRTNIWTNRFSAGTGSWGTAEILETDNAGDAVTPQIAVDPDTDGGNAIVVWSQSDGTRTNIRANRYNGAAWDGAVTIEDNNENDANTPQIAMNAAGTAVAIWSQSVDIDVPPTVVTITIASPGVVNWTAHGLANGREVILETTDSLPTGLTAGKRYFVRDATADSFELSTTPGGASINTSGTQSGTHTATAVARFRIFASFLAPGGDWQDTPDGDWEAPVTIDNYDPEIFIPKITEAGISTEPQITVDGDGNAIAAWTIQMVNENEDEDEDGIITFIGANRYRGPAAHEDLRGWSDAGIFESGSSSSGDYDSPQVAVFPDFTAVAVWEKNNSTLKGVTITIASPAVVSWTGHGLLNDHAVVFESNGSLPTGLTEDTTYYVRNATADSFELSATPGGVSINTSGTQSGNHSATAFITSIQSNYFF